MLDKKYFSSLRAHLLSYAQERRDVIKISGDAQQCAKKAIFARQRDDDASALEKLACAKDALAKLYKKYHTIHGLLNEGSYKAALEEYVEAELFVKAVNGEKLGKISGMEIDADIYVGALCDVPGELYRYAIKSATARDFKMVKKCHALAQDIIGELVDMDLTGYNRQKFDQAKQALHKLEQVAYEVSMVKI